MPIHPLPQYEADLEEDRRLYENLKPPTSIVVRFGTMKMVGEFAYSGDAKPGCGSKIVVRTHRGTELGEMLTSTCPNAGCSKSVTRKEMLEYIENSGGKDYPFFSQGKVLRIATVEDLNEQTRLDATKTQMTRAARAISDHMRLPMKIVEAEPILGQEKLTFHFTSEQRVDFRELVAELAKEFHTRIEMHQVGARDEARLTADYERCGQHCCCKQFLKVLKPVSMKQAKIQKATLDPLKISGRCGRLMCCLRYEEKTYDELRARLPRRKTRVQTPDGWGTVLDSQILTQLVLVQLDSSGEQIAVAVEDLIKGGTAPPPPQAPNFQPGSGAGARPGGPPGPRGPRGPEGSRGRPDRPGQPKRPADGSRAGEQRPPNRGAIASAGSPGVGDPDIDDVGETDAEESMGSSDSGTGVPRTDSKGPRPGESASSEQHSGPGGPADRPPGGRRKRRRRRKGGGRGGPGGGGPAGPGRGPSDGGGPPPQGGPGV